MKDKIKTNGEHVNKKLDPLSDLEFGSNAELVTVNQPIQNSGQAPVSGSIEQLDFFVSQAENAYSRIYDTWSNSGRAAAYNDCKESMADAIHLARQLGLDDKVIELEKKLKHYKEVFHHQMNF